MPQADSKTITGIDPIFALIAEHRIAARESHRANTAYKNLADRLDSKEPKHGAENNKITDCYPKLWIDHAWAMSNTFEIKKHLNSRFSFGAGLPPKTNAKFKKLRKMAETELLQMLHKVRAEHVRKQKVSGLTEASDKKGDASRREQKAFAAVCKAKPSTRAGLIALLQYVKAVRDDVGLDDYEAMLLFPALVASVKSLSTPAGH